MKSFEFNTRIKYSGQSFKNIQHICKPHITNCLAAYFFFEAYKYNSTGNGVKKNIQQQQGQQQMLFKQSQNELGGKKNKRKTKWNETFCRQQKLPGVVDVGVVADLKRRLKASACKTHNSNSSNNNHIISLYFTSVYTSRSHSSFRSSNLPAILFAVVVHLYAPNLLLPPLLLLFPIVVPFVQSVRTFCI